MCRRSGRNRAYLMPSRMKKIVLTFLALFLLPIAVRAVLVSFETRAHSWHEADWSSIGSLPPATSHPAARVLFLSARTGRWKGIFATHSWIVLKRENAYLEPLRRGRLGQSGAYQRLGPGRPLVRRQPGRGGRREWSRGDSSPSQDRSSHQGVPIRQGRRLPGVARTQQQHVRGRGVARGSRAFHRAAADRHRQVFARFRSLA